MQKWMADDPGLKPNCSASYILTGNGLSQFSIRPTFSSNFAEGDIRLIGLTSTTDEGLGVFRRGIAIDFFHMLDTIWLSLKISARDIARIDAAALYILTGMSGDAL